MNAPQIIAVVQLLISHVRIYVVAQILRTTIVEDELTLIRSSVMMMILVKIKTDTVGEADDSSDSSEDELHGDDEIDNDWSKTISAIEVD